MADDSAPPHKSTPHRGKDRVPEPRVRRRTPARSVVYSVLGTLFALILAAVAAGVWGYSRAVAPGPLAEARIVTIERGSASEEIASLLEREGVVENARELLAIIWATRYHAPSLKAGEYEFQPRASIRDVLALVRSGRSIAYKLTLPEGWTSEQLLERVRAHPALSGEITREAPEGSLLPDTYVFQRGTARDELIARMQEARKRLLDELWRARAPDLPVSTPQEAVILASIVEKETAIAEERPRVAAVFVNRLKKRMRLQSDPTIIYGLAGGKGRLDRPLTRSDIAETTPYNTYRIDGLPPTPIANPGREALAAVLNPVPSKELYFVADGTGGHVFAETLKEHQDNVRRWRQIERDQREGDETAGEDKAGREAAAAQQSSRTAAEKPLPSRRVPAPARRETAETVLPAPEEIPPETVAEEADNTRPKPEVAVRRQVPASVVEPAPEVVEQVAEVTEEAVEAAEKAEVAEPGRDQPALAELSDIQPGKVVKVAGRLVPFPRPRPPR